MRMHHRTLHHPLQIALTLEVPKTTQRPPRKRRIKPVRLRNRRRSRLKLTVRRLREGGLQPALGGVRGESAPAEVVTVDGPGFGLDELELASRPGGSVRLQVRGTRPLPLEEGEVSSLVLEVDGADREKRPFTGDPMAFGPLGPGVYRLRLVARAPGRPARPLGTATVELTS